MSAHGWIHDDAARSPSRHVRRNGLLQLGWPHFWLLTGILGSTLALLVLILFAAAISR
jgi:hypothetical protein